MKKHKPWTDQDKEILSRAWPEMGIKCAHMFPECTPSSIRAQAWRMGLENPPEPEIDPDDEPLIVTKKDRRSSKSCYGHIPTGAAISIFHLAEAACSSN